MLKNLVGLLCVCLMMIISGSIAMAHDGGGGKTKVIKSKGSGSFVSANFDFDHADLSTPATYINGEGISNAGKFTNQAVDEFAPDGKTCTVPGGGAGAGTEFTNVADVVVFRFTATGDLLFLKDNFRHVVHRFIHVPNAPFPVHPHRDRDFYWWHGKIFWSDWNLHI